MGRCAAGCRAVVFLHETDERRRKTRVVKRAFFDGKNEN